MTGEAPHGQACLFEKEREEKDDGRYIIFYTFEDDETGKGPPEGEGENG